MDTRCVGKGWMTNVLNVITEAGTRRPLKSYFFLSSYYHFYNRKARVVLLLNERKTSREDSLKIECLVNL